jgi:putative ABC transport system permease protein
MLQNQFKIAIRTLFRYKFHSLQNIIGLSLALAVSIIGLLYISSELSYEKKYAKSERIFRINTDFKLSEQFNQSAETPDQMGPLWQKTFPEVENFVRIFTTGGFKVRKGDVELKQERGAFIDTSLFSIFDLAFISKSGGIPLSEPNTVVITKSMALKYFGRFDVAGSVLSIDDLLYGMEPKKPCKIVGVIDDFPKNTQLQFDFLFPLKDFAYGWNRSFASLNFNTFVLLKPGTDFQKLNEKFIKVTSSEIYPQVTKFLHLPQMNWGDFVSLGNVLKYELFPLRDIHLAPERNGQLIPSGNRSAVRILTILMVFTIVMAIVNFINLSTALAMNRAKQIGILKILGSSRRNLIVKLLIEAFLIVLCSALIASVLAIALLPFANVILNVQLQPPDLNRGSIIISLLGLIFLNTVLSGFYPAFYLSGLKPTNALQGSNGIRLGGGLLRRSLTLLQFIVAICLVTGTVIIYSQLHFLKKLDVGYNREQVFIIDNISVLQSGKAAFQSEINAIPGVVIMSMSSNIPTKFPRINQAAYSIDPTKSSQAGIPMNSSMIDNEFLKALDIKIKSGDNFNSTNNFRKIIINEAAADAFGLKDPINSKIYSGDTIGATIIGVIKNYHYESLRQSVSPLILYFAPASNADFGVIRFAANSDFAENLKHVNTVWKKFVTSESIQGYFLDESFNNTFKSDETIAKATVWVASIAICICSIGLFGLITFITSIKRKEIGIRKVLGASPYSITTLLSQDFLVLIALAFFIATPISWWAMNNWLQDFVYRIDIKVWMVSIGFLIALVITATTVGYQAIRAAVINPVESLKDF